MYHLVWKSAWDAQAEQDRYRAASLETEGFIHCTRKLEVLAEIADLFFGGEPAEPLLRLTIDPEKVAAEIREEDDGAGRLFPHVYGPIEKSAVVSVSAMVRRDGRWRLPEES
jgi:uncharacterized protein (DUF952 family)